MPAEKHTGPTRLLTWLATMPNESPAKMLVVAVGLCLVCSVVVSTTAVVLRPLQERNETLEMRREILKVAGLLQPGEKVETLFRQVETRMVDLASGDYATDIDPATFDPARAARDPVLGVSVPREADIARIKRRARFAPVYLVRDARGLRDIILPVYGYGLWSTMYGFVALAADGRTIRGITFYQHAETPGLGSEIASPRWHAKWVDKLAYDEAGTPRIAVAKGVVAAGAPDAVYQVDGISGATLTSNGVTNLMHYWLGAQGFGPYLARLRTRGG